MILALAAAESIAQAIWRLELRDPGGGELPEFSPGAHVTLRVPNGLLRSYSLCNDPIERDRYVIAVKREAPGRGGRGGSASLIDDGLRIGATLEVGRPINNFALAATAKSFIFVAGGIGITPILSMLQVLARTGTASFRLLYLTRSRADTPFYDELKALGNSGTIKIHHDGGDPARSLDLWPIFEKPTQAHIYCCGPAGLMDAVRDMTGHWSKQAVHFESFSNPAAAPRADDAPFRVRLARTGTMVEVGARQSILEALRASGLCVPSSCESGTCGSCRTGLVAGAVDHRDMVLAEHERANQIMVCVSRAGAGCAEIAIDR